MAKFTAIEWQSFSLKKDVETIVEKLQDNRTIQVSLLGEVILVILCVTLTKFFADIDENPYFWAILLILSIIPLPILVLKWIKEKHEENKPGSDRMNVRTFIDTFDNEITYCTLKSESFHRMLVDALAYNDVNTNKISKDVIHFYYIQVSYYFQKAIADLNPINNIVDKVLFSDVKTIMLKKCISFPRYKNIENLLVTIFKYLEAHKDIMNDLDGGELIVELNEEYRKILDSISIAVSQSIKTKST
jgi:hypothetical protein